MADTGATNSGKESTPRKRGAKAAGITSTEPAAGRRPRARRLNPDVRRALILDAAGQIVLQRGVSNCTLEEVAIASRVSKPLVYKYFASRDALLGALLEREFELIRGRYQNILPPEASAREAHRVHIRRYMEYLIDRGGLLRALVNDAGVNEQVLDTARSNRRAIMAYWTEKTMETYGLPREIARMGMMMTITALDGAEGSLRMGKVELDRAADFWTTFILAGWEATSEKFANR